MTGVTNWATAILVSLSAALATVFAFIPKLVGFLVILLIGWIVGLALEKAITYLLRKVGFERVSQRIGLTRLEQQMGMRMDTAGILGKVVFWFVFLIFLVPAVDALGIPSITVLLGQIIAYIPNVFVAILVIFLGFLLATVVADLLRGAFARSTTFDPNIVANIARYAIIGFAALIALEQLQIAPSLLNILFTAIVGSVALAFGLAFGLGGREAAQRWLARGETTWTSPQARVSSSPTAAPRNTQPNVNQAPTMADERIEQQRSRQYPQ